MREQNASRAALFRALGTERGTYDGALALQKRARRAEAIRGAFEVIA